MKKTEIEFLPKFFDRYIAYVNPEFSLLEALENGSPENLLGPIKSKLTEKANYAYAEGKWTVAVLLQHCLDTERIFAYRAMCISRGEILSLPGFDENLYANQTENLNLNINDVLDEFNYLRKANILMYKALDSISLNRKGICNNSENTPAALGFTVVGHLMHHLKVLKEKYEIK